MPKHLKKNRTKPIDVESESQDNMRGFGECFVNLNRATYIETAVEKNYRSILITFHGTEKREKLYTPIP